MTTAKLELVNVEKTYQSKTSSTLALTGIDLTVRPQEFV